MDRLIGEQGVIDAIAETIKRNESVNDLLGRILAIPSAESKTGHWIFEGNQCFSCSSCGRIYTQKAFEYLKLHKDDPDFPNNCPNCGMKMFKTGSWLFYGRLLKCSNCGYVNDDMLDECPNCKAKMFEPQEGANE